MSRNRIGRTVISGGIVGASQLNAARFGDKSIVGALASARGDAKDGEDEEGVDLHFGLTVGD